MAIYFADTSFWIALSSTRDQYHSQAIAWQLAVVRTKSSLITTDAVLWEWLNAFADVSTRGLAVEGYRRIHADERIEVIPLEPEIVSAAVHLYRSRSDKNWSLTDCLSFLVMENRGLSEALSTDRHFEQAGFKPVLIAGSTV